jgi:hypothetical protein
VWQIFAWTLGEAQTLLQCHHRQLARLQLQLPEREASSELVQELEALGLAKERQWLVEPWKEHPGFA